MKIGIVGFSRRHFDHHLARQLLEKSILKLAQGVNAKDVEIVSGLTNAGVPKLAYEIAQRRGFTTVGISAKRALAVRSGIFPCDKRFIVGEQFGDESGKFIAYIDCLIRVGGGPQSRKEVDMFREKKRLAGQDVSAFLIEEEVAWLGN